MLNVDSQLKQHFSCENQQWMYSFVQFSSNYAHSVASKLTTYFSDSWNLLDVITISLFVVGMVLRFIPDNACFEASRVFLSINLISFFFRILHIFSVNKELGPKLVMIGRMVRNTLSEVVQFLMIYIYVSVCILIYKYSLLRW